MPKELSVDEAVARAQRAQDDRINAIRALAQAGENLSTVRKESARRVADAQIAAAAEVAEAERSEVVEYDRALAAGWTPAELRKIGFNEPAKKARVRKRAANAKPRNGRVDVQPAEAERPHLTVVDGEHVSA